MKTIVPSLARADFKYLLFAEVYTRVEEPKTKRKAFGLLEAAITCFSRKGLDQVTLEMIAREAGVTRNLLKHYFKDLEDIRELSVKYIRLLFQRIAIDALASGEEADVMLARYVDACFYWVENFRVHALVWLAFLHRCSRDKKLRELNTLAGAVGEERIANLIRLGCEKGVFAPTTSEDAAKVIQSLITGALIISVSEELARPKGLAVATREQCLAVAGLRRISANAPVTEQLSARQRVI